MKSIKRYLIRLSIALLTFIVGMCVYLFAPPLRSSLKDIPPSPRIALVPTKENKGKRCEANTLYVIEKSDYYDDAVVDSYCAEMQMNLIDAAITGDVKSVHEALMQGANANSPGFSSKDVFGEPSSALLGAYKNPEIMRLLLDNGADINEVKHCCGSYLTALNHATDNNQKETVRLLLARGAKMNIADMDGNTAFDYAVQNGRDDIAELFDEASKISLIQRARLRIAKLFGINIKDVRFK